MMLSLPTFFVSDANDLHLEVIGSEFRLVLKHHVGTRRTCGDQRLNTGFVGPVSSASTSVLVYILSLPLKKIITCPDRFIFWLLTNLYEF